MRGSQTPRGSLPARESAASDVAFHVYDRVGTPYDALSELNSPACVLPDPTLRRALTGRQRMVRATVCR